MQKLCNLVHNIFGGKDLWKRSGRLTKASMVAVFAMCFIMLSLSAIVITIKLPTAPVILPEEMVEVPPMREKKYKIIFADSSEYVLQVEKPKPKIKPTPKPPPPPPPQKAMQAVQEDRKIDPVVEDKILGILMRFIEKNKQYPRQALRMGIEGRNILSVIISANGQVASAELVTNAGNTLLDNASQALAHKVVGLQLPNPDKNMTVRIPIVYAFK